MSNIGLVMSGGMAKGAYELGALKAISELFDPSEIKYKSASSVGVLNTYGYITGKLDEAEKMWRQANSTNTRYLITHMLKSAYLQDAIARIYHPSDRIDGYFYISLVNMSTRTLEYTNIAQVRETDNLNYLKASVAMPLYNKAVIINNQKYYDGAVVDNIPIYPLLKHPLDLIICIYFDEYNYTFEDTYLDNKIIKINFPDNKIISNSIFFEQKSIDFMIKYGYEKTKRTLQYVFKDSKNDLESCYRRIELLNERNSKNKLRITGDVVVNNMNRITKKLTKAKVVTK